MRLQTYRSLASVQGGRVLQLACWCGVAINQLEWRFEGQRFCLLNQIFSSRRYVESAWCTAGNRGPKPANGVLGWFGRSSCFRSQIIPSSVPPINRKVWVCERYSYSAAIVGCSVVNAGTWNGVYSILYTVSHGLKACILFCTLTVTVSRAERSFSSSNS